MTTATRIREIIREELGLDEEHPVPDEARFIEDLGADSLDAVELVMAIEEAFQLDVLDEVAEGWRTVGEMIAWVQGKVDG